MGSDILVTGANGFVGRALMRHLDARGAVREASLHDDGPVAVGNIDGDTDWSGALEGIRRVVHLANRAHVMREVTQDRLGAFRSVNVEGTVALAEQAASSGVRRFVYVSSIKALGESTPIDAPFTHRSVPAPVDPYGISKFEAENALWAIARRTGMEVAVIRPPLVYGPGVKANFLSMLRWVDSGLPMPLGAVDNLRSMVSLDNLLSLIQTCLTHPTAPGHAWLVSDGEDLSTPSLIRRVAVALGKRARLMPIPVGLMLAGARILGEEQVARRLFESLAVDISTTRSQLQWTPPMKVDEALLRTARHWQGRQIE